MIGREWGLVAYLEPRNEAISSKTKRRPPIGAQKAQLTPAITPIVPMNTSTDVTTSIRPCVLCSLKYMVLVSI